MPLTLNSRKARAFAPGTASAVFFLAAALLLALTPHSARAEPLSMQEMQRQLELLSAQVEKLSSVVEAQGRLIGAQKAKIEEQSAKMQAQDQSVSRTLDRIEAEKLAAVAPAAGEKKEESPVRITMSPGPRIESADGKYSFQPFGRVHLDATFFDDDKSDHPDNANFRRARLGFRGNLGEDFNYRAEVDFAGEAVNVKEIYLSYTGFDIADLYLGSFKPAFGLEQNTSSNYMPFMENSAATRAFTRDQILGAAARAGGDNWSFGAGLFNEDAGSNNGADESWSFDARGSADLLRDSPHVAHVGFGGSYRTPNQSTNAMTFSGRPANTGTNLVTTGAIPVNDGLFYGPELAAVFGPVWAQGEYFRANIDRRGALADPDFSGWYAGAGLFLTGETRPYSGKTGNFERVKPLKPFSLEKRQWGAAEIAARYDVLDLNDPGAGITGGEMKNWTLGLNWYLSPHIRMMFNLVGVNTDGEAVTPDDDPTVYNMRAQWDF